jgi:hypothetical protein
MNARLAISLAALAGCSWGEPLVPEISAVTPEVVANDADAILVVHGAGFVPSVEVDFDDPARSEVASTFRVELRRGDAVPVPLGDVTVVSPSDLRGRVPAGNSPGAWDVVVMAPGGDEVRLVGGLKVSLTTCVESNGPCDDRNSCTAPDACQGLTCQPGPSLPDGSSCEIICIDRTVTGACAAGACVPTGSGC